MKNNIPTAKEVREIQKKNHREKHWRRLKEKTIKPDLAFYQAFTAALECTFNRLEHMVCYGTVPFIRYTTHTNTPEMNHRIINALDKVFTSKGYTTKIEQADADYPIIWIYWTEDE